jgi:hypothetical protein
MRLVSLFAAVLILSTVWAGVLAPGTGLRGSFYATPDLSGPAVVRYGAVDAAWKADAAVVPDLKPGAFSAQWRGYLLPAFSESYTFTVTTTGGVRLMVGDRRLINNWTPHPGKADTATIALQAGKLTAITLQLTQPAGEGMIKLQWASKSQPVGPLPLARLYPPLFSPAQLVYSESTDPRASALYVTELDGTPKKITAEGSSQPAISPDGKRLIFSTVANQVFSAPGIYRIEMTGLRMNQLTRPGDPKLDPAFTASGQSILYVTKTAEAWEIWSMWSDGTHKTKLLESPAEVRHPLLSADGSLLLFQEKQGGQWEIFRAKGDGTEATALTSAGGYEPIINRQGSLIYFVSERTGFAQLYTMKPDGSEQNVLLPTPGAVSAPFFDRTGTRLGYVLCDAKGKSDLFLMDLADRVPCRVTNTGKCIAAAMTPIQTMPAADNLVLWLNAQQPHYLDVDAQNRVASWQDASIRGNTATQADAGARPTLRLNGLNNYPTVYFDGNNRLQVPDISAGWPGSEGTLVVLFQPADWNQYTLVHQDNGGQSEYWRYSGNGDGYIGTFCPGRYENYPPQMPNSGIHLLSLTVANGQLTACLDGTALAPRDARFLIPTSLTIGTGGDAGPFRGDIAELAIFNRALTPEERQQVEDKFRALYGVVN